MSMTVDTSHILLRVNAMNFVQDLRVTFLNERRKRGALYC